MQVDELLPFEELRFWKSFSWEVLLKSITSSWQPWKTHFGDTLWDEKFFWLLPNFLILSKLQRFDLNVQSEPSIPVLSTVRSCSVTFDTMILGDEDVQWLSSCSNEGLLHKTEGLQTNLVSWVLPPASGCRRLHPSAWRSSRGSLLWWGAVYQPQQLLPRPGAPPKQTPPLLCSAGDLIRRKV